jgi:hypothetical protein
MHSGSIDLAGEYLSSESPLLVFVSSVISGMEADRDAITEAILSVQLARPWVFEKTPPSPLAVEESYLSQVRKCDLFVVLASGRYSKAVQREVETAFEYHKRVLAFVRKGDQVAELMPFLRSVKYREYSSLDDLKAMTLNGILDEVKRSFRAAVVPQPRPEAITASSAVPIREFSRLFAYFTVGPAPSEHQHFLELLAAPFGAELNLRPGNEDLPPSGIDEIRFDDYDEAIETIGIYSRVSSKIAKINGMRSAIAQKKALTEEVASIASQHLAAKIMGKTPSASGESNIRFLVFGTRRKYAKLLRSCRVSAMLGESSLPHDAGVTPICFTDFLGLELWLDMFETLKRVGDDKERVLQVMADAALRYLLMRS